MTSFTVSSHRLYWLFDSQQQLDEQRQIWHDQRIQKLKTEQANNQSNNQSKDQSNEESKDVTNGHGHSNDQSKDQSKNQTIKDFSIITIADQQTLVQHFSLKLTSLCQMFTPIIPYNVRRAAQSFLYRYFVRQSILDTCAIKHVMLACLYLATKSEEYYIPLSRISEKVLGKNETIEMIDCLVVRLENRLIEGCGFHLKVFQPDKAVRALIDCLMNDTSFKQLIDQSNNQSNNQSNTQTITSRSLIHQSNTLIDALFLTDGPLLFTHSLIGLTSVIVAVSEVINQSNNQTNNQTLDQWIDKIITIPSINQSINPLNDPSNNQTIKQSIHSVIEYITHGCSINQSTLKVNASVVSKKLKGLIDQSNNQSVNQADERVRAEEKAARKAAKREMERKKQEDILNQPINQSNNQSNNQSVNQDDEDDGFVLKRRKLSISNDQSNNQSNNQSIDRESQRRAELRVKHQEDMKHAFPGFGF